VSLGDGADDGESEATGSLLLLLLAACGREGLEEGTDGSCGEAGTGIVHDQQNRPVRPTSRYVDPAACRGVADGEAEALSMRRT